MALWEMSVSGGILILAILAVRRLFQSRVPRRAFLILWAAALLRLLIPWRLEVPVSIFSLLENAGIDGVEKFVDFSHEREEDRMGNVFYENKGNAPEGTGNGAVSEESLFPSDGSWISLWKILYFSGVLFSGGFYLKAYLKYRRLFCASLPAEDPKVLEWLQSVPLKRKLKARSLDLIGTPMTYGVLRPVILLPKGIQWEDSRQMEFVLTHELIHVRRFDAVWKFFLLSAACIHWFNPLAWLMQILANRDLELACDEEVIEQFGQDSRKAYAMSLISLAERKGSVASWGSGFSKDAMEERIDAIMRKRKFTKGSLAGAGILVMFAGVLFAATLPQKTAGENAAAVETEASENADRYLPETEAAESAEKDLPETEATESAEKDLPETEAAESAGKDLPETAVIEKVPDLRQFSDSEGMVQLPLPKKNPSDDSEGIDSEAVWEGDEQEPFVLFLKNVSQSAEFPEYEKYGLIYDEENAHFLYDGEIVGNFKDQLGPNLFRKFTDEEGTVGLTVKRDGSWKMMGFTVKSADKMAGNGQDEIEEQ